MSYLTQFAVAAAGATLNTLTGDAGGAISPTANNINLLGGNVLTTTGAGSTITFDLDNGSNGEVLIGGGSDPAWAAITSTDASITISLGANTIDLATAGGVADSFPTDSGTATPAAGVLTVAGGVNINTAGSGSTVTVNLDTFTAGSVIFSSGAALTEDNANFFWDDTNNRLGIGTTTPLDSLHVVDGMNLVHVAAEADDHALEITCDAAGFSDVKAVSIDFITGAVAGGDSEEAILINVDETGSSGGEVFGVEVLATAGSATAYGLRTGVTVGPVAQFAGTFIDADTILNKAVDVTAALANGGAGAITAFVADNDTFTIGDAAKFGEIEVILTTGASGAGIAPTFEYSTGVGLWAAFGPTDGTNGFRNTGEIAWDPDDIAWMVGTGSEFLIRITRTRNTLSTVPILDEIQIAGTTTYTWDKDGEISILSLIVADLTQYTIPIAGASGALDNLADGLGTSTHVLTSNGAGAEPTWQASGASATFPTDSGTASPSAGALTVAGGTNINTAGAASTVTINLDAAITLATSVTSPIYQTGAAADLVLNMADDAATYSVSFTNNSDAEVAYIDSLGAGSFTNLTVDNININGNTIISTDTNGDITISPDGTGTVVIDTDLDVDNLNLNGNTIISTDTNGDIVLTPDGTGTVNLSYLTQYTLPIAGASGAVDDLADGLGSAAEVLTSNGAGAEPTWQAAAVGGIGWNEETGTSVTMVIDNGYITNNAGLVTATLPTTAALGSIVRVAGKGAGGWKIAQNASEIIHFGTTDTTTGVGGSLASTDTSDAVELLCIVADTEWVVLSSLGNITIV